MPKKKTDLYSVDVMICATAYIKADSEAEALTKAIGLKDCSPTILDHPGGIAVTGRDFSDPGLPEISLSPAMTIHGVCVGEEPALCEKGVPLPRR